MRPIKVEEGLEVLEKNKVEVLDKMSIHQPVVAPRPKMFWTEEEHRLVIYHNSYCVARFIIYVWFTLSFLTYWAYLKNKYSLRSILVGIALSKFICI